MTTYYKYSRWRVSLYLFVIILTFATLIISSPSATAAEVSIATPQPCSIPQTIQRVRPDKNGPPTKVKAAIILLDLSDINETNETFEIDFVVALQWQDTRLSEQALGISLEECKVRLNEIWHPVIDFVNEQVLFEDPGQDVDIDEQGIVRLQQRITGILTSPMELYDFPFDSQRIHIMLASFEYGSDDVIFIVDKATAERSQYAALAGWEILSNASEVLPDAKLEGWGSYARMQHVIVVQRLFGYWFWTLFVPLTLILLMAWSVFWIDAEIFFPQITIGVTSVFTMIAFQLSLRNALPQIEYLTRADKVIIGAIILVFLAMGKAILNSRLVHLDRVGLATNINVYGRWIYVSIYLALILIYLVWR